VAGVRNDADVAVELYNARQRAGLLEEVVGRPVEIPTEPARP